jgi:hypothetical protein
MTIEYVGSGRPIVTGLSAVRILRVAVTVVSVGP